MTTLVIDGDIIAYKVAVRSEQPINWGNGLWTLHSYEHEIIEGVDGEIERLMEETGADDYITSLSSTNNYRKTVASYYKANRNDTRKPMLLPFARDYIMDKQKGLIWEGVEADDVLGVLISRSDKYMSWSIDKDLMTIPGRHWMDGEEKVINQEDADHWFYMQTLMGDSTDNYKGCPKVGLKTAEKILAENSTWETVVAAFEKAGLSEEDALENARLARILRDGEYNNETGEVKLWLD